MDLVKQNLEYYHTMAWLRNMYCGLHILKFKTDLEFYEKLIEKNKPDIIIETGTLHGGSALWFQDRIKGQVITIDIYKQVAIEDPRIKYIIGSSTDPNTVELVKSLIPKGSRVMVVLDSDHTKAHVEQEIKLYSPLVTSGQALVVEDTMFKKYFDNKNPANDEDYSNGSCSDAVEEWDKKGFKMIQAPDITMNPEGWFIKL